MRALLLVSALPLLVACSSGGTHAPAPSEGATARIPVSVRRVQTASFAQPIELSGTLTAVRSVTVGAISAGKVVSVDVRVGDRVSAGQAIAKVDASGYEAGLAQAEAGVAAAADNEHAAQAQVAAARSQLQLAQTTAGRMSQLYVEGAISKQQRDEVQAGLASAQATLAEAKAGLSASTSMAAQARSGVAAATVPLQNATVDAPFDGIVTAKFVEAGAVVGPGSPIVTVQNTGDLELDVALPNDDVAMLVPQAPVRVRVDALNNASLAGRVRAIVPMENPALRSALVKIAVESRPGLLAGMYARVTIEGRSHAGSAVPLRALVNRAGQSGVFVVRGGVVTFVPVQTGTVGTDLVEVFGLAGRGDEVAVSNLQRLTEGTAVAVVH